MTSGPGERSAVTHPVTAERETPLAAATSIQRSSVVARLLTPGTLDDLRREMFRVGCDPDGVAIMAPLAHTHIVRLEHLSAPACNILKQELLAAGGDAAVHRDTITALSPRGGAIVFGTRRALLTVAQRLGAQPFGLAAAGRALRELLEVAPESVLRLGTHAFATDRTLVMGVLNVTPDSFSDGGAWLDLRTAVAHAEEMLRDGADIIDVGGVSTRPGATAVSAEEEWARVGPVLDALQPLGACVSIDTFTPSVARKACERGVVLVNDVTGLAAGDALARIAAVGGAGLCVMHMRGTARDMQAQTQYDDLLGEIVETLGTATRRARAAGVPRESLIVDPGLGFAKTGAQNLVILRRLGELATLGYPVLVGASRKSFLGALVDGVGGQSASSRAASVPASPRDRLAGSLACAVLAAHAGARIVRVHDVGATVRAMRVADAVRAAREDAAREHAAPGGGDMQP